MIVTTRSGAKYDIDREAGVAIRRGPVPVEGERVPDGEPFEFTSIEIQRGYPMLLLHVDGFVRTTTPVESIEDEVTP